MSPKFFSKGSGLWPKSPVGSVNSPVTCSTPNCSNNRGRMMPPTELTVSMATRKCALRIAYTSTNFRFLTKSMCFWSYVWSSR